MESIRISCKFDPLSLFPVKREEQQRQVLLLVLIFLLGLSARSNRLVENEELAEDPIQRGIACQLD